MKSVRLLHVESTALLHLASLLLAAFSSTAASECSKGANIATFYYEAILNVQLGQGFPLQPGQRAYGSYSFDLDTPKVPYPFPTNYESYDGALTDFSVTMPGFGSGSGDSGNIAIADQGINYTRIPYYYEDSYTLNAPIEGIVFPVGVFGDGHLSKVLFRMNDSNGMGLNSEQLSVVPPVLEFFLDSTGPTPDYAEANFTFSFSNGSFITAPFRLTALTSVPEPSAIELAKHGIWLACLGLRVRFKCN